MGIEQPVDEMKISGSATTGANSELAREMGLAGGGESCSLFVPNIDPFDLALAAQRIGQPIKAIADDAINPFDAGCDENVRKLIRYLLRPLGLFPLGLSALKTQARRGAAPGTYTRAVVFDGPWPKEAPAPHQAI